MTRRSIAYYETSLWCYTDHLSYSPGEKMAVRASAPGGSFGCRITRIGAEDVVVFEERNLNAAPQPFSPTAFRDGCNWPVSFEIAIDPAWPSGYYRLQLLNDGGVGEHFFVIRNDHGAKAPFALVLATNTYNAYNSWGGKCLYGTDVTVAVEPHLDTNADRSPIVSVDRPFSRYLIASPAPTRIADLTHRGFGEGAGAPQALRDGIANFDFSLWDTAAGYMNKWEHVFARWAEREGYELAYLTQEDLRRNPNCLDGHRCYLSVGHDEYWSWADRDCVETFVENGGRAAFFSGNACYWQVRFENNDRQMVGYKYDAHRDDPVMGTDRERFMTGMWADPAIGRPETQMKGTTFTRAGYSRIGLCMGARPAGYTVFNEDHWSLDGANLFYGDMFGEDVALASYEMDGCAFKLDDGLPVPTGEDGADPAMEIIALAPASLGESEKTHLPKGLGHTDASLVAERIRGADTAENRAAIRRAASAIVSFKKGRGEVYSTSGTEWAWGLDAREPYTQKITQNVLRRLGGV